LLGIHPSFWSLVQQTSQTISRLAERGNTILIGRGAHAVTSGKDRVFHVRLVGSLAKRIEHVQDTVFPTNCSQRFVFADSSSGRRRYLKKYFGRDIEDPLSYHLVVNTEFVSHEKAARLIGEAALENFRATPPLA
jgi:cytidylate kinase